MSVFIVVENDTEKIRGHHLTQSIILGVYPTKEMAEIKLRVEWWRVCDDRNVCIELKIVETPLNADLEIELDKN